MTEIDVPDWVVEVAARVVAKSVGEDYDSLGPFTQKAIKATQRECITAALGAWVVPTACTEPWRIEYLSTYPRNTVEVSSMDTLSAGDVTLYTLRQEKPE